MDQKMFPVLACVALMVQALPPLPGQTTGTAGNSGSQRQQRSATDQKATAKPPSAIHPSVQSPPSQNSGNDPAPKDPEYNIKLTSLPSVSVVDNKGFWDYILLWGPWIFALALVCVGAYQVRLMMRQTGLMKRQADLISRQADTMDRQRDESSASSNIAAKTASDALVAIREQGEAMNKQLTEVQSATRHAETQAQALAATLDAMKRSERAWVLVSKVYPPEIVITTSPGMVIPANHFFFDISNKGRTVARLMEMEGESVLLKLSERLPDIPQYTNKSSDTRSHVHGGVLAPNDSMEQLIIPIDRPISNETFNDLLAYKVHLYVYGYIRYFDFLEEERRIQFCFECIVASGLGVRFNASAEGVRLDSRWRLAGPPDYNTHT